MEGPPQLWMPACLPWPSASAVAQDGRKQEGSRVAQVGQKLGMNVVVKKRVSQNRRVKGFEAIGQVARYLGPIPDTSEGHYVLTEDEKVMRTTRVVPFDEKDGRRG